MTNWINDDNIQGEMTAETYLASVKEQMKNRVEQEAEESRTGSAAFGNDGLVEVYEEWRIEKGVSYRLAICKYFAVTREMDGTFNLRESKWNRLNKHVVIEGRTEIPDNLKEFIDGRELLWHDSNHSHQQDWTLRQMWEWSEEQAKEDIEIILHLRERFDARVAELRSELDTTLKALGVEG